MMRICCYCRREISSGDMAVGESLPLRDDEVATHGVCLSCFKEKFGALEDDLAQAAADEAAEDARK